MWGLLCCLLLLQSDEVSLQELQALTQPAPSDERTLRALVEQTLPRVAKVMRSSPPKAVVTKVLTRSQASRKLRAVLDREYPNHRLSRLGAALQAIHLLEPEVDLEREAVALYAANVGGFYDPHEKTLYLLADQPGVLQQLVIAHELAHAVQDEQLGLERATRDAMRSEDAQMALSAAIEGNAQAVAAAVVAADSGGEDGLTGTLLAESTALSASIAAESSAANPWLALQLGFPYSAGADLVRAIATKDDPAACRLLRRLPTTTAQVLDPAAYRANESALRGAIGLSSLLHAESVYETSLGEANLNLLTSIHGVARLGNGWRGDVLEVVRRQQMESAAWAVAFREAREADAFGAFYSTLVKGSRTADDVAFAEKDGQVSAVLVRGKIAAILIRVPRDSWRLVAEAAVQALR